MITTTNVSIQFGKKVLFDEVNIKFYGERCYGMIGANGAGKSTFLKVLTKEIVPNSGYVTLEIGKRMAVLNQDHFMYDNVTVLNTVIMGYQKLWRLMQEKDAIYLKPDFNEEDGLLAADLELKFEEMNGWNAESDASNLLCGLGIPVENHSKLMKDLEGSIKVRALLAQALFGNPDLLILDEPTNHLDLKTIEWLEEFLLNFKNTVIVVSHDRHFLDTVCTNIADIDFGKIKLFTGNYSFWYESSQLALRQKSSANKKSEEKIKELKEFISRFSANASKSKQATSRKKLLEKINLDEILPSSRKYPAIIFNQERQAGDQILEIENMSAYTDEGDILFKNINIKVNRGDKIAILSKNKKALEEFYKILNGQKKPSSGKFSFGQTVKESYLPNDNSIFFDSDNNLVDWLRQYSTIKDQVYIRGFLGKMLFSGEETFKSTRVLSGGEKVRCMISKMMLAQANLLMFNEPTSHLDLESIQAFNNALIDFKGTLLISCNDHTIMQTVTNRIIEINQEKHHDKLMNYNEFIEFKRSLLVKT